MQNIGPISLDWVQHPYIQSKLKSLSTREQNPNNNKVHGTPDDHTHHLIQNVLPFFKDNVANECLKLASLPYWSESIWKATVCVMQGPLHDLTVFGAWIYSFVFPRVVVSCWKTPEAEDLRAFFAHVGRVNVDVIESEQTGVPGMQNVNYQRLSTLAGLNYAEKVHYMQYAVKMRCNFVTGSPWFIVQSLLWMLVDVAHHEHHELWAGAIHPRRYKCIMSSSIFFRPVDCWPFHCGDFILAASIPRLRDIFEIQQNEITGQGVTAEMIMTSNALKRCGCWKDTKEDLFHLRHHHVASIMDHHFEILSCRELRPLLFEQFGKMWTGPEHGHAVHHSRERMILTPRDS